MSDRIATDWLRFVRNLLSKVEVPRSLPSFRKPITGVELHTFGDASGSGISAAGYTVITQASGVIMSRGLSQDWQKRILHSLRLELVSAHMTANIVDNVRNALSTYPVKAVCGWNDSTVALHWIKREVLTSSSLETDSARSTQRNSLNGDMSTLTKAQLT